MYQEFINFRLFIQNHIFWTSVVEIFNLTTSKYSLKLHTVTS